jgi:hypothetical protein
MIDIYITIVTFDYITMIITWLHLHKTHVSNNIKQKKWKETYEKIQRRGLYYVMLRSYVQMK